MESDSGLIYLASAYGAFFLVLAVYLDRLRRRDRELWGIVKELEERVLGATRES